MVGAVGERSGGLVQQGGQDNGPAAGAAGEAGHGGDGSLVAKPSISGGVRLLVGGKPVCGGTLITNAWVVTADQCAPENLVPGDMTIGYGGDSDLFEQTRTVREIARFPGNDGSRESRGRDLVLLGVSEPFEIAGKVRGYEHPTTPWYASMAAETCLGWDLATNPQSPENLLHAEVLAPFHIAYNDTTLARERGDVLTFMNSNLIDEEDGILPMPADVGMGCLFPFGADEYLMSVEIGRAASRLDGAPNALEEANAQNLGESAVRNWLDSALFSTETLPAEFVAPVSTCSFAPDTFEVVGLGADGRLSWRRFTYGPSTRWEERPSLDPPPTALSANRVGLLCRADESVELVARGVDGSLWWRRRSGAGVWLEWSRLDDATTPVTSGISVLGVVPDHFHVFAVGENHELRHAEFNGEWRHVWEDLGGDLEGDPAARMVGREDNLDVFSLNSAGEIWQLIFYDGTAHGWMKPMDTNAVSVSVSSPLADRLDLLGRTDAGKLWRRWYSLTWVDTVIDSGIDMPDGEPSAVASQPGVIDVVLTLPEGNLWHASWPRTPE